MRPTRLQHAPPSPWHLSGDWPQTSRQTRNRPVASEEEDPVVDLNELVRTSGEWLRGSGPESDIVISSRIRLARNLAEFPFISRAGQADRTDIEDTLRDSVLQIQEAEDLEYV